MYTPPLFKTDRSTALAFAEARGFGTVCAWDGRKPTASSLPFCVDYSADGTPQLAFHLARQNGLIPLADGKTPWLMTVAGPDAYVSADWYASPDQVPTWLYKAVHLSGTVRLMPGDELATHLDALSEKFEGWLAPKPPWTTAKMTAGRLETMKRAITGLVMTVDEIEGSFKLNQHKSDADFAAVATALARQPDPGAQALAADMRALRTQAFTDDVTQLNAMATPEGTM